MILFYGQKTASAQQQRFFYVPTSCQGFCTLKSSRELAVASSICLASTASAIDQSRFTQCEYTLPCNPLFPRTKYATQTHTNAHSTPRIYLNLSCTFSLEDSDASKQGTRQLALRRPVRSSCTTCCGDYTPATTRTHARAHASTQQKNGGRFYAKLHVSIHAYCDHSIVKQLLLLYCARQTYR